MHEIAIFDEEDGHLNKKVTGTLTRFSVSIEECIHEMQQANNVKEQENRGQGFRKATFQVRRKHEVTNNQGIRKRDGMTVKEMEKRDQKWQSGRNKDRVET